MRAASVWILPWLLLGTAASPLAQAGSVEGAGDGRCVWRGIGEGAACDGSGSRRWDARSAGVWASVAAGGVAAVVGVAAATTEAGRYRALGVVAGAPWSPLFSRLEKGDVLDQPRRARLYELVRENPGACLGDLRRAAGLGHGALMHHLAVLERQGFVRSSRDGFRRRFHAIGDPFPGDPYLTRTRRALLEAVEDRPGSSVRDLAGAVGLPRENAAYHVRRLLAEGRVVAHADGARVRYFPASPPPNRVSWLGRPRPADPGRPLPA